MSPLNVHFRRKTFFEKSHELTYFSELVHIYAVYQELHTNVQLYNS